MSTNQKNTKPKSVLFRLKPTDTPTGISYETLNALCEKTGLNKTELIHYELRALAERLNILPPH